ncbi:cell wall-binding repeat-containing protein [Streptomyces sp. 71268]|uniref:cell wall-binding repeat-containing protein n=1 Tax=Streptomyces sp. 71268 TaxID=3002640 RepID=UPI0023F92ABC|nr:cell wall-binding repeat-containing protein [Streptomyces sp. 71268]WEV24504.1 cell wall-binding repeat-containing protein [Streptomyces sp. 71268]
MAADSAARHSAQETASEVAAIEQVLPGDAGEVPTARFQARRDTKPVELVSRRTETSQTFANPDGSFTTEMTSGPERIKQEGKWREVDVRLANLGGGVVGPKVHPESLHVSPGGGRVARSLNDSRTAAPRDLVTLGTGNDQIHLQWKGGLPAPELSGTTARYRKALPGADVLVEATRSGFAQYVELAERPTEEDYSYVLPVKSKGLEATEQADGSVHFIDVRSGSVRAVMPAPIMWDATVDAPSGKHSRRAAVSMDVVNKGSGTIDLVIRPDRNFLADKNTRYPVTIDPSTSALSNVFDTYVQRGDDRDWSSDTELDFGNPGTSNPDGSNRAARSFIHWNTEPIKDALIAKAELQLYNFHSGNTDCKDYPWTVWDTGAAATTSRWSNQPEWRQEYHSSTQTKGNPDCGADGWIAADATELVQTWASAKVSTGHMGLRTTSDDPKMWKRVNSSDNAENPPELSVNYNYRPQTGVHHRAGPPYAYGNGEWIVNSTTPVLRASFDDVDGDTVNGTFEIRDRATGATVGNYLVSNWVPAGEPASVTVPSGLLRDGGRYEFRTSAYDGTHHNTGWSAWQPFRVDSAFDAVTLTRIAGTDVTDTTVKISQARWKSVGATSGHSAEAAVITSSAEHHDGAVGIPLAKAKKGPLLTNSTDALDAKVALELTRILPSGKTVYLVGSSVSAAVEKSVRDRGYTTVRFAGVTPTETSLKVARDGLSARGQVAVASADSWKDSVSAASAVAAVDGALILSDGPTLDVEARKWLDGLPDSTKVTAVGGPARRAYASTDTAVVGRDAIETSAFIADKFMPEPGRVGMTTTKDYRDGLSAGAYAAAESMPLLLNSPTVLDQGSKWFGEDHSASARNVTLFGGTSALSDPVGSAAKKAATEQFIDGEIVPAGESPGTEDKVKDLVIIPDWADEATTRGYDGGMNDSEFDYCKWPSRWSVCKKAKDAATHAQAWANVEGKPGGAWPGSAGNGGKKDAYRHCIWNGKMALEMGSKTAKGFADRHEKGPKPPNMSEAVARRHHEMDYYNNAWGRFYGQYAQDAQIPSDQAYSQVKGWCLLSVNDGTLDYMKH